MTKPVFTIYCGINGAGKTTLHNLQCGIEDTFTFLNSDNVVREMNFDWKNFMQNIRAGQLIIKRMKNNFENRCSCSLETTSLSRHAVRYVKEAKEHGFEIHFNFIYAKDVDDIINRIHRRVLDGGHGIPDDVVKSRFNRQMIGLVNFIALADQTTLYENNDNLRVVAKIGKENFMDKSCGWAKNIVNEFNAKQAEQNQLEY